MLRVYTASKLQHAEMWESICANNSDFIFHARWLKHVTTLKTEDSPENARNFWLQDIEDVKTADAVLVFGTMDEDLRGALVEAGCAIAMGIPIIVAGSSKSFGTWQYHPGVVFRADSLDQALTYLQVMNENKRSRVIWDEFFPQTKSAT